MTAHPGVLGKGGPVREAVKGGIAVAGRFLLGSVTHAAVDEPLVALTFDDGPHPVWTPRLLDLLGRHGARATFFVVGRTARRHPEIVERAAAEGHTVANHTWSHESLPLLRRRWRRRQVRWCQEALPPGQPRLLRPPWGHQTLASRLDALLLGYRVVAWSVTATDWEDRPAAALVEEVERSWRPGSIVVFHDALHSTHDPAYRDREPTLQAVATLLERHASRFRFVTVPELLTAGRPRYWPWFRRPDLAWLHRQV